MTEIVYIVIKTFLKAATFEDILKADKKVCETADAEMQKKDFAMFGLIADTAVKIFER